MTKQAAQQSCNVSLGNWFSCFSRHYFTPLCLSSITLLSLLIAPLPVSIFSWKLHAPLHCKKIENEKQLYPPALPSLMLKWTNHPDWSYLSQPIALCWSSSLLTPSRGFPGSSDGKESACNAGNPRSIPGWKRSSGEVQGNPLQYSCLENFTDRGAWQTAVQWKTTLLQGWRVGHSWATNTTSSKGSTFTVITSLSESFSLSAECSTILPAS